MINDQFAQWAALCLPVGASEAEKLLAEKAFYAGVSGGIVEYASARSSGVPEEQATVRTQAEAIAASRDVSRRINELFEF